MLSTSVSVSQFQAISIRLPEPPSKCGPISQEVHTTARDAWLIGIRHQWASIRIMTCFIRKHKTCPAPMLNDTTHQRSDSGEGVLQSAACVYIHSIIKYTIGILKRS